MPTPPRSATKTNPIRNNILPARWGGTCTCVGNAINCPGRSWIILKDDVSNSGEAFVQQNPTPQESNVVSKGFVKRRQLRVWPIDTSAAPSSQPQQL